MAYNAEISRANPTCFLFLIDQSGSMAERWGGDAGQDQGPRGRRRHQPPACKRSSAAAPRAITSLDRYYIGVIGYGGQPGEPDGQPGLPDRSPGGKRPAAREHDREPPAPHRGSHQAGRRRHRRVDPDSTSCSRLVRAEGDGQDARCARRCGRPTRSICQFIGEHPACFPPIVINISDGMATDGDAGQVWQMAAALRGVASQDGNVLLFNVHLSVRGDRPILFPTEREQPAGRLRPAAVSHVQPAAAGDAPAGADPGGLGPGRRGGVCLQCRLGLGDHVPGHRHPGATRASREERSSWPWLAYLLAASPGQQPGRIRGRLCADDAAGRYAVADGATEGALRASGPGCWSTTSSPHARSRHGRVALFAVRGPGVWDADVRGRRLRLGRRPLGQQGALPPSWASC